MIKRRRCALSGFTKLRKKRGFKESSRRWLQRHLNDPYVKQSKIDGYRSRAAYKLIEIDDRYKLLKPNMYVVDLGCSPGGWCQVAAQRIQSPFNKPRVFGLDILPMDPLPGVAFLHIDFFDEHAHLKIVEALEGHHPDIVLSDLAAPTTGNRYTDHLRTFHLCEVSAHFALSVLRKGGHFLAKTFQGGAEKELLHDLKQKFESIHHVKPSSSRAESPELYILAKNFHGKE